MHTQKWEVYLVTEVDPAAWPDGVGLIKAGLRAEVLDAYRARGGDWAAAALGDFRAAVDRYREVRVRHDALLDAEKARRGWDPAAPLGAGAQRELTATLPEGERALEAALRSEALAFVGDVPVRVGDVVTFPALQMHCLTRGIRVVEFQTPHYERLIVMFAQKALTQSHWDTAEAVALMRAEPYRKPSPEPVGGGRGWTAERFVDFPQFLADRLALEPGAEADLPAAAGYRLLMGVDGAAEFYTGGPSRLAEPGVGWFLPASAGPVRLRNPGSGRAVVLLAEPKWTE
jgi:hypothetical protein